VAIGWDNHHEIYLPMKHGDFQWCFGMFTRGYPFVADFPVVFKSQLVGLASSRTFA
jgi:hypothetical protein